MQIGTRTLTVVAALGIACAVVAAGMLWLLLTDPVTVASAVSDGGIVGVGRSLLRAVSDTMAMLLRHL